MPTLTPELVRLPVTGRSRRLRTPWLAAVAALRDAPGFFWLDASRPDAGAGRFSFAGAHPWATLRVFGRSAELAVHRAFHPALAPGVHRGEGAPLALLRALLPRLEGPAVGLPFRGGAVGVLGYELARALPPLAPLEPRPDPGAEPADRLPDLAFQLVDRLLAHDAATGEVWSLGLGPDARAAERACQEIASAAGRPAPRVEALLVSPPGEASPGSGAWPEPAAVQGPRPEEHAQRVARILSHVAAGDCYQACLTHRLRLPPPGDPFALHAVLRARSPAAFAAYLELPGGALVSSSPERFLWADARGQLESRPIKGTCPREADPARDAAARAALLASEKDRAENLMIVDLVRNDLGRVCRTGSVHVPSLFAVESFASVSHLVSTIRGRLRPGLDALDAVEACFPAGSMTGAPKLAAMRILQALEPDRRGFYAGALGYLDVAGGLDLSVVIRSAWVTPQAAFVGTGGGIVADSQPAAEWAEAGAKTQALVEALAVARSLAPAGPGAAATGHARGPRALGAPGR